MDTLQKLTHLRSLAFSMASSGKYGKYPFDDTYHDTVEEGFSDNGTSWTALDGTVINFHTLEMKEFIAEEVKGKLVLTSVLIEDGIKVKTQKLENIKIIAVNCQYCDVQFTITKDDGKTSVIGLENIHPGNYNLVTSGIESAKRLLSSPTLVLVGRWKALPRDWEGINSLYEKEPQEIHNEIKRQRIKTGDAFIDHYTPEEFEETFNGCDALSCRTYFIKIIPNPLKK